MYRNLKEYLSENKGICIGIQRNMYRNLKEYISEFKGIYFGI